MSHKRGLLKIFVCLLGCIWAEHLHAQALTVLDCQGFTRAIKSVDPGSLNKIEINVTDSLGNPAQNVEVTLANTATGEVTTTVANNGVAVFENLSAGTFTAATSATGTTVGAVTMGSMGVGALAAGGAVAGAGVVGGGAVVGAGVVIDNAVDSGSDDSEPEPIVTPTPLPTPQITPTPRPDDCECDPDATPEPLSPFE